MILTSHEIKRHLGNDIVIHPFNESQLNSNSYNLRLGKQLLVYDDCELDCKKPVKYKIFDIPTTGYRLLPGELYLGQTFEYTETRNLVPQIEGRSSTARLGITIHMSAGFGDIGFCGHWTLEICVIKPIIIYPEIELIQIFYHEISGTVTKTYEQGKYQGNKGVQPSLLYKDFEDRPKIPTN